MYDANEKTALYLIPVLKVLAETLVKDITPKMILDLGPKLYPNAGTKTWVRQVVTPIRTVINNAHHEGKCPMIRVKGYSEAEKVKQDAKRGSTGRKRYEPGSWEWLLKFREKADRRVAALALVMFTTGARISQAIAMHPDHLKLDQKKIIIPAAKGHAEREIEIADWLVEELQGLPDLWPRGWQRTPENRRVFGYADRSSPRKEWDKAITEAKIQRLPFHSAGRHGFGQELNIRNPIDEKAAGKFGGWSDTSLMKRTYTHAEQVAEKVHEAQNIGLKEAELKTKIPLRRK